jgi:type I restriction enzyme S subunit
MQIRSLKEICSLITKGTTPTSLGMKLNEGEINFIKVECLSEDGNIISSKMQRIDETTHNKLNRSKLQEGDILYSIAGSIGRMTVVDSSILPANTNQAVAILRPIKELIDTQYLFYFLKDTKSQKNAMRRIVQSVQTNLSLGELSSLEVAIPSLPMQIAIGNCMNNLDAKIASNNALSKTLEEIAQTIFKSWFIDFDPVKAKMAGEKPAGMDAATAALFPDSMEESELGLIPKGWDVNPAAELFEVGIGRTPPRKEPQWFCKGTEGIPWVSIRDMGTYDTYSHGTNESLTQAAVDRFKVPIVPENTVLMSFKLTVGKLCISDADLVTNEAIAHFRVSKDSPLNTFYTYLWLNNIDMGSLDSTSSIGTATNSGVIKQIKFLVPPRELLGSFHDKVSPIFSQLKLLRKQTTNLCLMRDSLLPRLISGELQIPEKMLAS